MILKRVGVFETNSSSCHSMAIVGRLQKKTQKDATIIDIHGELGYTPMFDDVVWTVKFDDYLWKEQQLCNPEEKLWFLLSYVYSEYNFDSIFADEFYKKIKRWLSDIGITLKEPDYSEYDNYIEEVLSQDILTMRMFQEPKDLYEYLFDDSLIIDIRSIEVNAEY